MFTLLAAVIVAFAILVAARTRVDSHRAAADAEGHRTRALTLLQLFAPALTAAPSDPHILLAWQPLADGARRLLPQEFALLDAAFSGAFPFSPALFERAHAQWTADWLAWERAHDTQYKLKTIEAEHQPAEDRAVVRARLDEIEREKLERYQRKYEEYVRVARALQLLAGK